MENIKFNIIITTTITTTTATNVITTSSSKVETLCRRNFRNYLPVDRA